MLCKAASCAGNADSSVDFEFGLKNVRNPSKFRSETPDRQNAFGGCDSYGFEGIGENLKS
jgi:hypothetical protein